MRRVALFLSILAWCLMGNHYHLVVKTRNVELWRSMARLQARVSRDSKRRRGLFGRLRQSRYRARVVDTNEYYRQVLAYVQRLSKGLRLKQSDPGLRRRPDELDADISSGD